MRGPCGVLALSPRQSGWLPHRGVGGKIQPELHAQYTCIPVQRDLSPSYTASPSSPLRGRRWPQEQGLCHLPGTPSARDLRYVRSKLAERHCWDRDPTDQSLTSSTGRTPDV